MPSFPRLGRLEFRASADTGDGPRLVLGGRPRGSLEARAAEGGGDLTPVMARLGPVDLETLDALITAGIAASRARPSAGPWPASANGPRMRNCASGPARSNGSKPSSDTYAAA